MNGNVTNNIYRYSSRFINMDISASSLMDNNSYLNFHVCFEIEGTCGYNTYKYTQTGQMTNDVAYYNIFQPIVIKSKDVEKIKEISSSIQNLLSKGIDINIVNTEYFYSKLGDLKIELLEQASADAKDRASAMLKATNNKPAEIQSVNMGVFQITPVDSNNVSNMGINDTTTIDKKVTAVANVVFRIK